jgi:hypothetical protein
MSYTSRNGRRPSEYASKINHSHIISDPVIKGFLATCDYPKSSEEVKIDDRLIYTVKMVQENPIKNVIAIDGGRQEIPVKRNFPSSLVTFFQFGALYFSIADLENLYIKPHIEPSEMAKLKEIQRYKFVLPTKNIKTTGELTLTSSIRKTLHSYFSAPQDGGDRFIDSLKWFLFEEYQNEKSTWNLAWCPSCGKRDVSLSESNIKSDMTFDCPSCRQDIYLTDAFRLHEIIDDELGATGIISYLGSVLEQMVLIHLIRVILRTKPSLLNEILFIKDGQLAFYGQTANLHRPMRKLINYLFDNHNLYLVGLEKSGVFVEHADEIAANLKPGTALLLNNDHIYKYITPGKASSSDPYGSTTYYGNKVIYKSSDKRVYVVTIATRNVVSSPDSSHFQNLDILLQNVKKLKCDMYDSSLIPVSLVNKLVSLSNRPSSILLEKFAKRNMNGS